MRSPCLLVAFIGYNMVNWLNQNRSTVYIVALMREYLESHQRDTGSYIALNLCA